MCVKRLRRILIYLFKLDAWHGYCLGEKEYAKNTIDIVNKILETKYPNTKNKCMVVEIGCGIGDIIGNIDCKVKNRIGIDILKSNVLVARVLHPRTHFLCGSFENLKKQTVDVLVIVNVLHLIPPEEAKRLIENMIGSNRIEYIVIDEVRNNGCDVYEFEQNGQSLLGESFGLYYCGRRIKAAKSAYRQIKAFKMKGGLSSV